MLRLVIPLILTLLSRDAVSDTGTDEKEVWCLAQLCRQLNIKDLGVLFTMERVENIRGLNTLYWDNITLSIWRPRIEKMDRTSTILYQLAKEGLNHIAFIGNNNTSTYNKIFFDTCNETLWIIIDRKMAENCRIFCPGIKKNQYVPAISPCEEYFKARRPKEEQNWNLKGITMRIATNNLKPFMTVRKKRNGESQMFGIDANLILAFQQKLKFNIDIRRPADGEWGRILKNGTWTGLMGLIQKKEADIAICNIGINYERTRVSDLSIPYLTDKTVLVAKAPSQKSKIYAGIRTFTKELWIIILLSFVDAVCFLYAINYMRGHLFNIRNPSFRRTLWFLFSTFVNQGCRITCFKGCCAVVFLGAWLAFVLVIRLSYSGPLISFMGFPGYEHPISSLADLTHAIKHHNYGCGTPRGTLVNDYFVKDKDDDFKIIADCIREDEIMENNMDTDDALERIMTENFVWFADEFNVLITAKAMGLDEAIAIGQSIQASPSVVAFKKNFRYRALFNDIIERLLEMGIIEKWKNDAISGRLGMETVENNDEEPKDFSGSVHNYEEEFKPLATADLKGPMLLIVYGFALSTSVLMTEIIFSKLCRR